MSKTRNLLAALSASAVFLLITAFYVQSRPMRMLIEHDESSVGNKEDPDARLHYEWMLLHNPATGEIPKDIREREMAFATTLPTREQMNVLNKSQSMQTANWVSRGPYNVGGRTRALAIDVANANHILAGGVSGGMWQSLDGGATWAKKTPLGSHHSVTCILQDTRAGQTNTWYYGTGERLGNSASSAGAFFTGNGIFKSIDNGATWSRLPINIGDPQNFDNAFDVVWNIAIDPTNGNLFAATYATIYRSTDGGQNWTAVLGGIGASTTSAGADVQVTSTGRVYATVSSDGTSPGIWTSTSGAAGTWTNINPAGLPATYARIVIGIAPSNQNSVYFLLGPPNTDNPSGHRIWKYDASGGTWDPRVLPAQGGLTGNFDSQGSYDLLVRVKPDNENTVVIGGVNLYRSTDGFATSAATNWIGGYTTANNSYESYPNSHADQHSFVFVTGSSVAYSGHDGGISKTSNILASTVAWTFLNNGYLTTQCYTVALDHGSSSPNILSGFQDNGCWGVQSSSSTAGWQQTFGGDGAYTAIANGGASMYVSSQNGNTYRLFSPFGSSDFTRVDPQGGGNYLFINPFALDQNNSNLMYLAGGTTVWRNSDLTLIPTGSNNPATVGWSSLSNSAMPEAVSALAISRANPANRLYIGTQAGNLKRVDGANTGNPSGVEVGAALPGGNIASIAIDPADANKVLVALSNYGVENLFYTANGGTNWTNVEGNLGGASGPSARAATIVTFGGTTTYYVGTSIGLYSTSSLNGSSTVWAQEGAATIGNVVVTFLDSRQSDGTVIVGTHANGTYSNAGATPPLTTTVYSGDANNDAVCDIRDILPIGQFYGATGPARVGGSTTWSAQTATVWSVAAATYADCDGNGTVEGNDITGIINNYGRTRSSYDAPKVDKEKLCNDLLKEIDSQPVQSEGMKEIRKAIIRYMQNDLGIVFRYSLDQNYPNPFNPSTTIRFSVPEHMAHTEIAIYTITGQRVWTKALSDVEIGNHEVIWNGELSSGASAASSMYFYRLTAYREEGGQTFSAVRRMLLIK